MKSFSQTNSLKKTIQVFKDRALCKCLASGLDSNNSNADIQKLIPFDPFAIVLYDSIIDKNLKLMLNEIYLDSVSRINTVSVNAQGKMVFYSCMNYFRSKKLDLLAKRRIKQIGKIKNLKE